MIDTVAGKWERGPYMPKDQSRNSWETRTREFFDPKAQATVTVVHRTFNSREARLSIFGDGGGLRVEASLPKLLYGNNLSTVCDAVPAMERLREYVMDYVGGEIRPVEEMECLRVDYCHNFNVGSALPEYVNALGQVPFLKHRRVYDGYGGVEWFGSNGRMVRAYDKYQEILQKDKMDLPAAKGVLRFEVQTRKKSQYLQRRLGTKHLRIVDALNPELAYRVLVETLDKMALRSDFVPRDFAKAMLDEAFCYRKATRLLGLLRRLETESIEDIKRLSSRSTFYSDKADLRHLRLFPPSSAPMILPGLQMPALEDLRTDSVLVTSTGAR